MYYIIFKYIYSLRFYIIFLNFSISQFNINNVFCNTSQSGTVYDKINFHAQFYPKHGISQWDVLIHYVFLHYASIFYWKHNHVHFRYIWPTNNQQYL